MARELTLSNPNKEHESLDAAPLNRLEANWVYSGPDYDSIEDWRCQIAIGAEAYEIATGTFSTPSSGRIRWDGTGDWSNHFKLGWTYNWFFSVLVQPRDSEWNPVGDPVWVDGNVFWFTVRPASQTAESIHVQSYAVIPTIPYLVVDPYSDTFENLGIAELEVKISGPGITGDYTLFSRQSVSGDNPFLLSLSALLPLDNTYTGSGAGFPKYSIKVETWNSSGGSSGVSSFPPTIDVISPTPVNQAYPSNGTVGYEFENSSWTEFEDKYHFYFRIYYGEVEEIQFMNKSAAIAAWESEHPGQQWAGTNQELWDYYGILEYTQQQSGSANSFYVPKDNLVAGRNYLWRVEVKFRQGSPTDYIDSAWHSIYNSNPYTLSYIEYTEVAEVGLYVSPPYNPTPAHEADDIDVELEKLEWENDDEPDSYKVYFGTDETPATLIGTVTQKEIQLPDFPTQYLEMETTYYWKVVAVYGGDEAESDVWEFTTKTAAYYGGLNDGAGVMPAKPTNPTPGDAEEDVATRIFKLTWVSGARTDNFDVYFRLGTEGDFTKIASAITGTSAEIGPLMADETYSWRVDARNAYGLTEGDVWTFETAEWLGDVRALTGLTIWLSQKGNYNHFGAGLKDNNSFSLVIPSTNTNRWIGALESLLLGTAGDEWVIGSNKLETPISPTNFKVKQQSEYGGSQIQPIKVNSSLIFIDYVARKIREMTYEGSNEKYVSPDLTALAEHITLHGITTVARQKNPDSIIWCSLGDGSLISMTYEREQDVVAWAKHPIDGLVQSVAVLPGATEDVVYVSVQREINGETKVYLEKLAPRVFETKQQAFFVDCGVTVSVYASDQIFGLDHLAGERVACVAGGEVIYDGTEEESEVSVAGILNLPEEITESVVHVGLPYTSVLQPMRIVIGDSMGSTMRVSELVVSLFSTGAVKYGLDLDNLYEVDLSDNRWTNTSKIDGLFTGEVVLAMEGGFDPLTPIYIVSDSPLPMSVRCITPRIMRTGR